MKKYKYPLAKLYDQNAGLSERLTSVINNPLTPDDFEKAWQEMLDEFTLQENHILGISGSLFPDRKMWIKAFFKEIYCGTMQSTQRRESVNSTVKGDYIDNSTPIHDFAKRFLDVLCHTKESEARERFNSEREILTSTYYGYEAQLGKLYTRKVYNKFKEELKSGTAFSTREEPGNVGYYLVQHRKVDTNFPWLDHAFCIKAIYNIIDPEQSEFKCECMTWEHTGLFCCHLICAFTHLCVERVPSKYIMKRYTKTPFVDTAFDRHDKVFMGPDGDTKARCTASIMADLFKLQRSAVMPGQALEKEKLIIRDALPILDAIPHDLGLPTRDNPSSPNMSHVKQEEINMSASTPPVSTTKGTRRTGAKTEERPPPHFQRDRRKQRRCLRCGLCDTGHNAATCERNKKERANNISKRPRGRPRGSSRRRGNMRGGCTSVSESNNMQGDKWQSNGWCDDASSSRWRKSWDRNIA